MEKKEKYVKRLYRSRKDTIIAGVCGGIAEYFRVDPVWPRLIAILLIFFDGVGILAYLILWILMPENPYQKGGKKSVVEEKIDEVSARFSEKSKSNSKKKRAQNENNTEDEFMKKYAFKRGRKDDEEDGNGHLYIGLILIFLGLLFLAKQFFYDFIGMVFWPVLIIGIGIILLVKR